jgi:hypothetical protein
MTKKDFAKNYLQPSDPGLDISFKHPILNIPSLRKCGDFIIQGELDDTYSTNIITKYESEQNNIRFVEVYKNTQNRKSGVFVRLVGTFSLVKSGYPPMFLDAAVSNVNPITSEKEHIKTRVTLHLPQSKAGQRNLFFTELKNKAEKRGISHRNLKSDALPEFWGSVWLVESKGFDPEFIRYFRNHSWVAYNHVIEKTRIRKRFDYSLTKSQLIFSNSRSEHLMFEKIGLSVPMEAQAAFFSAMVAGIE